MNQIDAFEGANHHFEVGDETLFIPAHHIDAIDSDAFKFNNELEHRIALANDFSYVVEFTSEQHTECG